MNRRQKLEEAYRLLTEVADSLSVETEVCPCCERKRFVNWHEAQAQDALRAANTRLNKVFRMFDRGVVQTE